MEVILFRPKQFADRVRAYDIKVDGKSIASLKAGKEIKVSLPDNARILTASIDWCSSNEFELSGVRENERIEIKNAISKKIWIPFFVIYAATFKKNSYLSISKNP